MANAFKASATFPNANVAKVYFLVISRHVKDKAGKGVKEHQRVKQVVEAGQMCGMWVADITDIPENTPNRKVIIRAVAVRANGKTIATMTRWNGKFPP